MKSVSKNGSLNHPWHASSSSRARVICFSILVGLIIPVGVCAQASPKVVRPRRSPNTIRLPVSTSCAAGITPARVLRMESMDGRLPTC